MAQSKPELMTMKDLGLPHVCQGYGMQTETRTSFQVPRKSLDDMVAGISSQSASFSSSAEAEGNFKVLLENPSYHGEQAMLEMNTDLDFQPKQQRLSQEPRMAHFAFSERDLKRIKEESQTPATSQESTKRNPHKVRRIMLQYDQERREKEKDEQEYRQL